VQAGYGFVIDAKKCINGLLEVRLSARICRAHGGTRCARTDTLVCLCFSKPGTNIA
jgi:hypothetical protein